MLTLNFNYATNPKQISDHIEGAYPMRFLLIVKAAVITTLLIPASALPKHVDILSSFDDVNIPLSVSDKIQSAEHRVICAREKPNPIHAKTIVLNWDRGHWIEIRGRNHQDLTLRAVRGNLHMEDYIPKRGKWISRGDATNKELETNFNSSRFTDEEEKFLDRCMDERLKAFEEKRAMANLKQSIRTKENLVQSLQKIQNELKAVIEKLNH